MITFVIMMKRYALFLITLFVFSSALAQQGNVIRKTFDAPSLQHEPFGEPSKRNITIYLPPHYETDTTRYPVVYYLHGFLGNDSITMNKHLQIQTLMDSAIRAKLIEPMILVAPNSYTQLGGSFYSDHPIGGNWAKYIAEDVVHFIDENFRTIPQTSSRGLVGHSMGGFGALKIQMLYPDVFQSVYSMSPACLSWGADFTSENQAFILAATVSTPAQNFQLGFTMEAFYASAINALGRAIASNNSNIGLSIDYPCKEENGKVIVDNQKLKVWEDAFPYFMLDRYAQHLKKLKALYIDWGVNDELTHIPVTCVMFTNKLKELNIPHTATPYIGTHNNKLSGFNGRFFNDVLPFFQEHLERK